MSPGPLRVALGAAIYPALMVGSVAAALTALDAGSPAAVVVPAINIAAAALIFACERALPYRAAWNKSSGDLRTDVLHVVLSNGAGEIGRALVMFVLTLASVRLSAAIGSGLWPSSWPLAAQLALALPLSELGIYWLHRLEHHGGFLWRLHAVHHSAPRLYFLNSARNHPLDTALSVSILVAPLALLGAGERVLAIAMVVWGAHALLQHSNIDVRLGPLNYLLSMAEVHRWHHSRRIEEANANYGQTLLVWDIVFRTRRVPPGEPPVDIGLAEGPPAYPTGWLGQVVSPFDRALWRAEEREGARSELPPREGPTTPEP